MLGFERLFRKRAARRSQALPHMRYYGLNPRIHPVRASRGYAGHLVDTNGTDWIDLLAAWGTNILGYGYPRVTEAIERQARRFTALGMEGPEFDTFRDVFRRIFPSAGAMRFGKNGSDVTSAAVRLARAVTGRERILHSGYHSFHDWYVAATACPGIPESLRRSITTIEQLTPDRVEAQFRDDPEGIACLIFDTVLLSGIDVADVKRIAQVVRRHGALLIFDELLSGFRVAPGGMQEVWGIEPDLGCYGKSMANGLPVTVLIGQPQYMDAVAAIQFGLTHESEAISVAAATATLSEILEKNVCRALAEKGAALKAAFGQAADDHGVRAALLSADARPYLAFDRHGAVAPIELQWLMIQELARDGILTVGAFNLCFSHTDEDIERIIGSVRKAFGVVKKAVENDTVAGFLDSHIHEWIQA